MKTMYLKDGRMVDVIHGDVNGKVLVAPYVELFESKGYGPDDYEQVFDYQRGANMIFVENDDLTEKAPVAHYNSQIQQLKESISNLDSERKAKQNETRSLENEIKRLEEKKGDTSQFIFDMSPFRKAKKLVFFKEDKIYPVIIDSNTRTYDEDYNPSLRIEIFASKKKGIVKQPYISCRTNSWDSQEIDLEHGVLFDPTDDEIITKTKDRCAKIDLDKIRVYDLVDKNGKPKYPEYLTENAIKFIEKKNVEEILSKVNSMKNDVDAATARYEAAIKAAKEIQQ